MIKTNITRSIRPVRCRCSRCGLDANAPAGSEHFYCRGFKTVKPLPALFQDLQGKNKGTWEPINATP